MTGDQLAPTVAWSGYLQRIRTRSVQMSDVIQGLMSLAKLNCTPLKRDSVNLSAVAQRMTQHCRDLNPKCAGDARIRPVLQVPGNPNLLLVVMQNLFGNTWKYTSKQSATASRWSDIHSDDAMIYFWRNKGSGFDMA